MTQITNLKLKMNKTMKKNNFMSKFCGQIRLIIIKDHKCLKTREMKLGLKKLLIKLLRH